MGVYINLHIVPEKIDPRAWAEMYDLSLEIIRNYPDTTAAGMSWKKKSHYTLPIYSRDLEEEVHVPSERRWHVVGDMESGLMAAFSGKGTASHHEMGTFKARLSP